MNHSVRQTTPVSRPRLAFVGLGWIGLKRLSALDSAGAIEVAACIDTDALLAARVASGFDGARHFAGLDAALDLDLNLDLDGIVIATPSALHEAQALAALDHGLPVFCQKPLATDAEGATRVIEHAAAADRLLGVDFCYRHVNGMRALRDKLRDRAFGEIVAIDLTFHNAYAPSAAWSRDRALAGGGCLLDLGVHLLDLSAWLQDFPRFEVEAARLFARGRELASANGDVEDLAIAQLRQANGACVRLACSWNLHAGQGAIIEVTFHGTRGGATWRNVAGSFLDFETIERRADRSEKLASDAGEWGPRALLEWTRQLAESPAFDPAARRFTASATTVDAIYRHGLREAPP
jgi:predicted dehydrogenase